MRPAACVSLAMLLAAFPTWAQDMSRQWARCLNEGKAFTADQSIGRSTAIIQAATEVSANMAIAFGSRGSGHASKGQYDRAIQDFDQAIRLKPKFAEAFGRRGIVYLNDHQYDRPSGFRSGHPPEPELQPRLRPLSQGPLRARSPRRGKDPAIMIRIGSGPGRPPPDPEPPR
jgi:hypothetical protein